jgi:peptidoglycan-N-acetylglucosamine deacetylase
MFYFKKIPAVLQWLFGGLVCFRIKSKAKEVYFTFDDGPHPENTALILDILKRYDAKGSFFCTGEQIEKHPELFYRIQSEGHVIGNHGYKHLKASKISGQTFLENFEKGRLLSNSWLFRPPYGGIRLSGYLKIKDETKIVLWDIMPGDFDPEVSQEECVNNILANIHPGSIIVLHDSCFSAKRLISILESSLTQLKNLGYSFSSLKEEL